MTGTKQSALVCLSIGALIALDALAGLIEIVTGGAIAVLFFALAAEQWRRRE